MQKPAMPSAFSWPIFVPSALTGSGAGELGVMCGGLHAKRNSVTEVVRSRLRGRFGMHLGVQLPAPKKSCSSVFSSAFDVGLCEELVGILAIAANSYEGRIHTHS